MTKKAISTKSAPAAIGPYSQAIVSQNFLFVSGQLPIDPQTGKMVEGSIEEKAHRVIRNIIAIAEEANADLNNTVKTTVFIKDMAQFKTINDVYAQYFSELPPARSAFQVAGLPLDADLEIETIISLA